MDLVDFTKKAHQLKKENKNFILKLKSADQRKLDDVVHKLHDKAFEEIDCLTCANCCKTTSPIFKQKDIELLSKKFKCSPSKFISDYLKIDDDNDYVLKTSPCPFLDDDNRCKVYEYRPTACREYPHTNRKKVIQLLDITFENTMICPAVFGIIEQLKKIPKI
jgi:Fe-S-cluster containining protein